MSVIGSNVLAGAAGSAGAAGYEITRSLRFDSSSSSYLNRTPSSAGNRKTWTWSGWVKRSKLGADQQIWWVQTPGSPILTDYIRFDSDDTFRFFTYNNSAGSFVWQLHTSAKFRDPSSWYHIVCSVDTTQSTASNRAKLYINGYEVTDFSTSTYPSQNYDTNTNNTVSHNVAAYNTNSSFFDGYLADVHFIDGQALAPTDFGEYDSDNNWNPKAYSGTYGTNGFHLDFSDNTSTTTIAEDSSGNNNDWTANNLSVASGAGNDSLIDTPTNYEAGSGNNGGNYATLNPVDKGGDSSATVTDGNLKWFGGTTINHAISRSTIGVSSGKWYVEVTIEDASDTSGRDRVGVVSSEENVSITNPVIGNFSTGYGYRSDGFKENNGSSSSYGASYTTGDTIGIALDMDTGSLVFYKNGSSQGTAYTSIGGTMHFCGTPRENGTYVFNFGQRPFAYTPPTGYLSLCTQNLADPTIADGSTAMDVALWTGTGSSQTVSLDFNPDLIWAKTRSNAVDHKLTDVVRGFTKILGSNNTAVEETQTTGITATSSTGFTIGTSTDYNTNSRTYVAWAWDGGTSTVSNTDGSITSSVRANPSAGFSIVSYTGTGSNATVGHGLNDALGLIIIKNRDEAKNWVVGHSALATGNSLRLNLTNAVDTASTIFNSTDPTSSVFSVGTNTSVNGSADKIIAYCFAPVEGYSAFGSYTGNGSADGPFVFTGFRPAFILIKKSSAVSSVGWFIYDYKTSAYNFTPEALLANSSAGTQNLNAGTGGAIDILSNGFKLRGSYTDVNASGATCIYAAFAEAPFALARAR